MLDSESGALSVSVKVMPEATVISPVGDIDLSGSPQLRTELRKVQDAKPAKVIVDLTGVPYMDSSGVATLVEAMKSARAGKSKLVLCSLSDRVRSIFEIARLESVFLIVADVDVALKA